MRRCATRVSGKVPCRFHNSRSRAAAAVSSRMPSSGKAFLFPTGLSQLRAHN